MQAKLEGDETKMCLYALQGGMLEEAHSLFFEKVAPKMIISGFSVSFSKMVNLYILCAKGFFYYFV